MVKLKCGDIGIRSLDFLIDNELTGHGLKDNLKRLRMTKYRLSKLTGLAWRTIHEWERGRARPTDDSARRVLKVFWPEKVAAQKDARA